MTSGGSLLFLFVYRFLWYGGRRWSDEAGFRWLLAKVPQAGNERNPLGPADGDMTDDLPWRMILTFGLDCLH